MEIMWNKLTGKKPKLKNTTKTTIKEYIP